MFECEVKIERKIRKLIEDFSTLEKRGKSLIY